MKTKINKFLIVICLIGGGLAILNGFFVLFSEKGDFSMQVSLFSFGIAFISITLGILTAIDSNKETIEVKETLSEIKEEIEKINISINNLNESFEAISKKIDEKDIVRIEQQTSQLALFTFKTESKKD